MSKAKPKVKPVLTPNEERALQPVLLDVPAAQFVANLEAKGEYTGERLRVQRPEVYERVMLLLSQGHGSQYIQDITGVSKNTVKAVRRTEGDTIDLVRARIAERNFDFADLATEAATLVLSEIMESRARRGALSVKDVQALQVAAGIATQNGQLLTGKPTVNIGVEVFSQPSPDLEAQIEAHIAGLKSAGTHSEGEKMAQKEGALLGDGTGDGPDAMPGAGYGAEAEAEANGSAATGLRIVDVDAISAKDDKESPAATT